MAIFDEIKTTTPYNTEDYVLRISMASEPNSYRLSNIIHEDGAYVFSIWHRSDTPCMITFQLFGDAEQVESTTEWKKYYKQIKIPSLTDRNIDITPPINSKTYYYEAFLAKGTIDTSWSPAPEDYDEKLNNVKTEFIQTAEKIEQKVTVNDGRITSLTVDVKGIQTQVSNTQGDISTLQQTSSSLSTEIKNAKNDISSLQQTATGLSSQISNNKDEISTLKQTASEFSTELSNAKGDISTLQQKSDEIVIQVGNNQDIAKDAQNKANENENRISISESTIKVLSDKICSVVQDENGSSILTQGSNGFQFDLTAIEKNLNKAANDLNDLSGTVESANNIITNINQTVEDIGKKTAYINMTIDEEGKPCIELGKNGNDTFKVRITNTSIDFLDGSSKIAYINNQSLYIEKAVIKSELQIGEKEDAQGNLYGFIWATRSNGNMGLRKVGGR